MDASRWKRLQKIFDDALSRPELERDPFVRAACEGDDALFREVQSLLQAETPSVLEGLALDVEGAELALSADEHDRAGERVGPYQIVREIGRGGMGAVYLAARADGQFEQSVALKLVRFGMHSDVVLRRFERERQILARLEHPGIARLVGGGLTEAGRPYFAMELVDGEPITDYCDRHRLGVPERIALFRQVCDAVQYAHRQLVVHRDLKPSNILVTPEGKVKLLDFGIAAVLADDTAERPGAAPATLLTQPGQFILTPEYAAPEQVRGEPITTATDVYALGVVLYELLSGRRPYTFDKRTPGVIEHVVGSVEPPRPSTVLTADLAAPTAEHFGTPTERLRRQLQGDLDVICLAALRKEPERRYGSPADLADDLRRHLEGLPVAVRRDTAAYRARKFARRHRAGLGATVVTVLLVGVVTALAFREVSAERDRARVEADKAEQVSTFLVDLFKEGDPSVAQGDSALVVDVLERGAQQARRELSGQPEVQATLLQTIGEVYAALGSYGPAEEALLDALDRERARPQPDPAALATTTFSLGELYRATGRYDEADSLIQTSLAFRRALPPRSPDRSTAIGNGLLSLANLRYSTGNYEQADSLGQLAEAAFLQSTPTDSLYLAATAAFFSALAGDNGEYARADSLSLRVLQLRRAVLPSPHADIALALLTAGRTKRYLNEYEESERYYRAALAMNRELYGDVHAEVGYTLNHLSSLAYSRGDYAEAERLAREGLEIRREVFGPVHVEVGSSMGNLARAQERQGDLAGARATLVDLREQLGQTVGEQHPFYGSILARIARIDAQRGQTREAERGYRDALTLMRGVWPDGHFRIADVAVGLARFLISTGQTAEAQALLDEADAGCRTAPDRAEACLESVAEVRAAAGG